MPIDSFTVLLFGLFIKLVLGGLFFIFWFRSRSAPWFAWWAVSLVLGSCTALMFMLRATMEGFITIGIGNAFLIAALAACWQGTRVFEGRRPLWWALVAAPALWLLAASVPAVLESVEYRIILSSLLSAPLLVMAAVELWRGRAEKLPSRWPICIIFCSLALFFGLRIVLIDALPFPFGALPMQPGWLGAFNLILFGHTLLLVVLVVSLSKERLEFEQRTKANTDALTGALNRRALMLTGERLLQRHQHEQASLCMLFLDLDHFKSFNDRFGHSGGDDVLTSFVQLVEVCIRPTDYLFRIGGEEFCCLLPHTTTEQAYRIAERVRHRLEMALVEISGTPVKATASLGIASTEAFGYDLDTLMHRADMAVYAAKSAGRNRVMVAPPLDVRSAAPFATVGTAA